MIKTANTPEKTALFIQRIKSATSEQHILLESNDLLSALMKQDVSVHQYYYYLVLMKKITETYEKIIVKHLDQVFPELNQRISSLSIEDDLGKINYSKPGGVNVENYSLSADSIDTAYSLGFMYVMEGSRLGGKMIFKHIQRILRFNEQCGAKYIADAGYNTGTLWKEFLAIFSEYITSNGYEEEAISGAKDAFSSIYNYFELNRHLYAV